MICGGLAWRLKRWTYGPGDEFVVADAEFLTGGRHTAGNLKGEFEELIPDALQVLAFNDRSGIQIHVVAHIPKQIRITGNFDGWCGFATEAASPAGREQDQVRPTRDFAGDACGVEAGGIHHP